MKTTLIYVGVALFLVSCIDTSNTSTSQVLPDDEMKARVEAEEILFEKEVPELNARIEPLKEEIYSISEHKLQPSHGDPRVGVTPPIPPKYPPHPPDMVEVNDPDAFGVYHFPEVAAQFPGGILEMKKFITSNLRYPDPLVDAQGTVYVSFVIEKDGSMSRAEVMRGIGEKYDQEALRVVKSMPNWIPPKHNGKVVASKVRIPISFTLN